MVSLCYRRFLNLVSSEEKEEETDMNYEKPEIKRQIDLEGSLKRHSGGGRGSGRVSHDYDPS